MRAWKADGIILRQERLAEGRALGIPMIISSISRNLGPRYKQILVASEAAGQMGATALLSLGLRHFGYCGLRGLEFSDNRGLGFERAIREAGHEAITYSPLAQHLGQSWYHELKHLARWLQSLPKPAGLMACNDDRARMLVQICHISHIRVPDDIAIIGVDNDEQVCDSSSPPLSSVALATHKAGYEAAALLDSMMQGRSVRQALITVNPTHVVSRQSTDTLAVGDPIVVRALRFIRDNANKDIRVADLREAVGISRRALQDRFKQYLGCTPLEEIHRCRIERLARLLVETNMTIGRIAAVSGFEVDAHVSRFFARHTGVTPLEYRRRNRLPGDGPRMFPGTT
jgi:LacI family transcriptional regulator